MASMAPGEGRAWGQRPGTAPRGTETSGGGTDAPPPRPAEPFDCAGGGAVLTADPAVIAELVEQIEEIGVVHLAAVGVVAVGGAGDLGMGVAAREGAQTDGGIGRHDPAMIKVGLQHCVGSADA